MPLRQRQEVQALPRAAGLTDAPRVHVAAAILTDARGRVLLARRTSGRDLAGLWEFPGGKVEAHESVDEALARELKEELGIDIGAHAPLIAVPHAYAHKRILLDVRRVASFAGRARGLESQALAWVTPEKVGTYPMPAADRPVVAALLQPDRYLITPEPGEDDDAFLRMLDRALGSGVRRVQLRARLLASRPAATAPGDPAGPPASPRESDRLTWLATQAAGIARAHGAQLLINSANDGDYPANLALAQSLGIGLHLTAGHLAALPARPDVALLAASCHDADGLRRADALGCDFAVLGPVQATATHPNAAPLGWESFAARREHASLPVYALGGLSMDDLAAARAHGAQGIAAIRGLWPTAE